MPQYGTLDGLNRVTVVLFLVVYLPRGVAGLALLGGAFASVPRPPVLVVAAVVGLYAVVGILMTVLGFAGGALALASVRSAIVPMAETETGPFEDRPEATESVRQVDEAFPAVSSLLTYGLLETVSAAVFVVATVVLWGVADDYLARAALLFAVTLAYPVGVPSGNDVREAASTE